MKKRKILFILLLVCAFPVFLNAKVCSIVSGTGKDIGDEIACGSEHFYIIESNDNTSKLLSKYNLYVGDKIEKDTENFNVEEYGDDSLAYDAADARCEELIGAYGEDNVAFTIKYTEEEGSTDYFCRIFTPLEYDRVKQNELAIGLYPTANREVAYPIYGAVYLDQEVGEKEFDENHDMIPETSQFSTYLTGYKQTLSEIGVNVNSIGFIKKSGVEKLINSVSDKKITIPTYDPTADVEGSMWEYDIYSDYFLGISKVNIIEYVPEKYKWIYATSYWTGSATVTDNEWKDYYDEFLTTVGDYCSYGRGCEERKMGLGLRPVIEINNSEFIEEKPQKEEPPKEEIKTEEEPNIEVNPKTGDNAISYFTIEVISLLSLLGSIYYSKKKLL